MVFSLSIVSIIVVVEFVNVSSFDVRFVLFFIDNGMHLLNTEVDRQK